MSESEFPHVFEPEASGEADVEQARPHVLIVDDHDASRVVCASYCDLFDHTSETARNRAEALEALGRRRFDVVVMNIDLEGAGGLQALNVIRSLPAPAAATPIIGLASPGQADDAQRWLAAGLCDVVSKPVTAARLFAALKSAVATPAAGPRSWAPAL